MLIDTLPSSDDDMSLLISMLVIRKLEERLVQEYPKQEMRCPVHFSIGQEAIAVGVSSYLNSEDWVVSNHRSHAHYIAKGGNLFRFISELYGKVGGCCAGRGGSMHLTDVDAGFLAGIPIVGSAIAVAAGVAMSQKWSNSQNKTVVYIGDAAVESGTFHESMNFVSLHDLPLLTVCENNEYSIFTPLSERQPRNRTILDLAKSHGIETFHGNGDDVLEVVATIGQASEYMKSSSRPAFVEFSTYRLLEHCGPNFDDDLGYRDPSQVESFASRDPIVIQSNRMLKKGKLKNFNLENLMEEIDREIQDLLDTVKQSPDADYSLHDSVYWKSP